MIPSLPVLLVVIAVSPAAAQEQGSPEPPTPVTAEEPATPETPTSFAETITVIGSTPVPALGVPVEKYPGNVQLLTAEEVAEQEAVDLSEALFGRLGSVNVIGNQSNPWQNDVTYRGFLASPLTGSPIGLSVYLDGMRFNDGFGDTVSWDLIPVGAIAGIDVIPGSNPILGLNTLGGSLAVRTRSGREFPGTTVGASGGAFGRRALGVQHGGARGPLDWYVGFDALNEDGWRDRSPSELRQLFTKLGWEAGDTALSLSYVFADNDLTGNGLVPESTLARDRSAVHTFPDQTQNRMHLGNLRGSHWLTDAVLLSGNAFYRDYRRLTFNGDAEVACIDDATGEEVFDAGGVLLHLGQCSGPAVGFFDEAGNPLAGNLEREASGEDRTTSTRTQDWGGTLQVSHVGRVLGRRNRVTAGVAYDGHRTGFDQREAEAALVPSGNGVGTQRTGEFETEVDVDTRQGNVGVYVTDTFDVTRRLALTVAGRYQRSSITIRDRSGESPALDGDHDFSRFSPAAGFAFRPLASLTLFASYSEGFRAPTPAELTCADPGAPCNLPNAFVADPPLEPVIARTFELGARGKLPFGKAFSWSLGAFRTDLDDDLLFTVVQTGGGGFFQNVGQTRRQGIEIAMSGEWKRLRHFASYAYLDATYESSEVLASVTEPGGVPVRPGDTIPGMPRHNVKVGAALAVLNDLWFGTDVIATSGSVVRDDVGQSRLDGHAIVNLHARYEPVEHLEVWARVDNVTNAEYETGGTLNFNAFASPIAVERFVAPGAPIAGWAGARWRF